jgi:hypothetical protein
VSVNHWLTKAFCRGSNFVHFNGIFKDLVGAGAQRERNGILPPEAARKVS